MSLMLDAARLLSTLGTGITAGALFAFGSITTSGLLHERSDTLSPVAHLQALAGQFVTGGRFFGIAIPAVLVATGSAIYNLPESSKSVALGLTSRSLYAIAFASAAALGVFTRFYMLPYGNAQIKAIAAKGEKISEDEARQRLQRFYVQHQFRTALALVGFVACALELLRPS